MHNDIGMKVTCTAQKLYIIIGQYFFANIFKCYFTFLFRDKNNPLLNFKYLCKSYNNY